MKKIMTIMACAACLALGACSHNKEKEAQVETVAAEEEVVGMEVETPEDSGNGVIAGGVDEVEVQK